METSPEWIVKLPVNEDGSRWWASVRKGETSVIRLTLKAGVAAFHIDIPLAQADDVAGLIRSALVVCGECSSPFLEKKKDKPPKAGEPWTDKEDEQLRKETQGKFAIGELAEQHGRTRGAITARLQKLGIE